MTKLWTAEHQSAFHGALLRPLRSPGRQLHTACSNPCPDPCIRQQWSVMIVKGRSDVSECETCQGVNHPPTHPRDKKSLESGREWSNKLLRRLENWQVNEEPGEDKAGRHQKRFPSTTTLRSLKLATQLSGWRHSENKPANRSWILRTHKAGSCLLTSSGIYSVADVPTITYTYACRHMCTPFIHTYFTHTYTSFTHVHHSYRHIIQTHKHH